MIKNLGKRKLSRTSAHRQAMLRNMAVSLFQHEKIKTTLQKARELISFSENLLTVARPSNLNARRSISREIKNKDVQKKIFEVLVPRYQDRTSGYVQVFKLGPRPGDGAEMVMVKLIQ